MKTFIIIAFLSLSNIVYGQNLYDSSEIDTSLYIKVIKGWKMKKDVLFVIDNSFFDIIPNSNLPDIDFKLFHPDSLATNNDLLKNMSIHNINADQQKLMNILFDEEYTQIIRIKNKEQPD